MKLETIIIKGARGEMTNTLFNRAYQILGNKDFDTAIMMKYVTPSIYEELPLRTIKRCILEAEPIAYYSKLINAYLLITVVPLNKIERTKLKNGDNTALVRIKSIGKIEGNDLQ